MNILHLDFETYYDREYSLKKMTMIEYIMDARFQPIILSYAWNNEPVQRLYGFKAMKAFLDLVDWQTTVVNAQNTAFDATILAQRFGYFAKAYIDTMAMARVTGAHVIAGGASLEKIAELLISLGYPIPPKGTEVVNASGMRLYNGWTDTQPYYLASEPTNSTLGLHEGVERLDKYGEYCDNDVELARQAFNYFRTLISPQEMMYGDMILKCYIQPQFYLDEQIIKDEIVRIANRDKERIQEVADRYFGGRVDLMQSTMRSVPKFTAFLKAIGGKLAYETELYGVEPRFYIPYKYSEKKMRNEPCYAKTHPPVIDILEGDDKELATIFQMKLAMTSSIELTRAKRFESIAKLGVGFGMPYSVSGAHTHRLGGCFDGEHHIYVKRPEYKTAICIPLRTLRNIDLVWDGENFVTHGGLVYKGTQTVIWYDGLIGTTDHIVFTETGEQITLGEARKTSAVLMKQSIDTEYKSEFIDRSTREDLLYKADFIGYLYRNGIDTETSGEYYKDFIRTGDEEVFNRRMRECGLLELQLSEISIDNVKVYDILDCGPNHRYWINNHIVHNSGGLNVQNLSSGRKAGQSNALKRSITAPDGYVCIAYDSSSIEARCLAYLSNDLPYLQVFVDKQDPYSVQASYLYGGDPDEIRRLAKAGVEPYSNIQRPTGKAIILGAGYSAGKRAFRDFAKLMGVEMSEEDAEEAIKSFRQSHPAIVAFWKKCDWVFGQMVAGGSGYFGGLDDKMFYYDGSRQLHGETVPSIRGPDGNWLHYYNLCLKPKEMPDGSVKMSYSYCGMKEGRIQWIFTYGGRLVENLCQYFAYAVMKYQAMLINKRYRIAGNTHDEWFITAPEAQAEEAQAYMEWCMRQVPNWAKGLPLDCEGSYAKHYGDC